MREFKSKITYQERVKLAPGVTQLEGFRVWVQYSNGMTANSFVLVTKARDKRAAEGIAKRIVAIRRTANERGHKVAGRHSVSFTVNPWDHWQ